MKKVDEILHKLEDCLLNNKYESIETELIELKDLSGGNQWKQLYISICAFLNTDGGILIVGVNENNKRYKLTGYDENSENKLKQELNTVLTDRYKNSLDLTSNIKLEIKDLLNKKICAVYVEKLAEDEKFVFYDSTPYKRVLTGDTAITDNEIIAQNQLKQELINARELDLVPNASISDLNVDKLNDYLAVLNRDARIETYKKDIDEAKSFLSNRKFTRNNEPTLLGMLVCGDNLFETIGNRADVSCFVDSIVEVAENKKNLRDNIIPLMDNAVGFVYKNIQIGVSYEKGGTRVPEYPEKLIREVVNNSLAHRDYKEDRFVSIDIKPNVSISVSNPGSFREEQKINFDDHKTRVRRLIPIPHSKNPRLTDILKIYDKYEAKTKGMSSLINSCLANEIDVPYYFFKWGNDISLVIPKGKVYDGESELWLEGFSGFIYEKLNGRNLTDEEKIILAFVYKSEKLNRLERYTILLTKDNNHFSAIAELLDSGLIYKHPQSPDIHPIYLVNRTLTKIEFSEELRNLFGAEYDFLPDDYKETLNAIFLHSTFSKKKKINARVISLYLYHRKNGGFIKNQKEYDNYNRKIRNIFNKLGAKEFIINLNADNPYRPEYTLNESFRSTRPPLLHF